MPYRIFSLDEAAAYLNLRREEIERMVKYQEIPFEKRGDRMVFPKKDIDAWASKKILQLRDRSLADYHHKSSQGMRPSTPNAPILPAMMRPAFIDPALTAKTKASVLRAMVALADKTGLLNNPPELLSSIQEREELCSTGVPGGLALLHLRDPQPYLFESSFMVLGRTLQEIPFGAPDGQPTIFFFLVCAQEARIHLHSLARLCLMAQKTDLLNQLRASETNDQMFDCLIACETQVLQ
jgi:nitrogen PTS system EIIA component